MKTLINEAILATDGVVLRADVYLPDGEGPHPALLAVAPYRKDLIHLPAVSAFRFRETGPIDYWLANGYAIVVADQRGTGESEGDFDNFGPMDQSDFVELIEWIAAQQWSTGKVAMIGESGYSVNQWLAAGQAPEHLTCVLIYNAFTDVYSDAYYHGGIPSMGFMNFWSFDNVRGSAMVGDLEPRVGGIPGDLVGEMLSHPHDEQYWRERAADVEAITVPALVVGFWYNIGLHLRGTLQGFERLTGDKKLLVLGGTDSAERYFDPGFLDKHITPWYDHWLKGTDNGVEDLPAVRLDVQNSRQKGLRDEAAWPLERAVATPYYLDPTPARAVRSLNDGSLSSDPPTEPTSGTRYDYPRPEWTVGTTVISNGIPQPTAGIVTFTSPPLDEDVEITGPIAAVLFAESDQTETQWFVKVSEQQQIRPALKRILMSRVAPDVPPPSTMVTRGWLKGSHRKLDTVRSSTLRPVHNENHPEPVPAGEVVRYDIEVWPTSYVFRKGNRIRVEIANGDSMIADGLFHHYYGHRAGTDTIRHDTQYPSHLLMPVMPRNK